MIEKSEQLHVNIWLSDCIKGSESLELVLERYREKKTTCLFQHPTHSCTLTSLVVCKEARRSYCFKYVYKRCDSLYTYNSSTRLFGAQKK